MSQALWKCIQQLASTAARPETAGTYFIFLKEGDRLLEDLNYRTFRSDPTVETKLGVLLYIGRATCLWRRGRFHMRGPSSVSSVRQTIGVWLAQELGLTAITFASNKFSFNCEHRLTAWLVGRMSILCVPSEDPVGLEQELLEEVTTPLNIQFRRHDAFARLLIKKRCKFVEESSVYSASSRLAAATREIKRKYAAEMDRRGTLPSVHRLDN